MSSPLGVFPMKLDSIRLSMWLVYPSTPKLIAAEGAQSMPAVTFHEVSGSRSGLP